MGDYFREIPVIYHNKELGTLEIGPEGLYDMEQIGSTPFHDIFDEAFELLLQKYPEKEDDRFLITIMLPSEKRDFNTITQRIITENTIGNVIHHRLSKIFDDIESIEIT